MRGIYLLIIFCLFGAQLLEAQEQYIHCGHLIDTRTGEDKGENTIVVEDGMIKSVITGYVVPRDRTSFTVDLKDAYVLPGLMDMHVHIEEQTNPKRYMEKYVLDDADVAFDATVFARITLMAGFTTVRDLGGRGININLRNAINAGKVVGPRIYTSGQTLSSTGGHQDPTNGSRNKLMGDPGPDVGVVNGADECAKGVRQQYKQGADLIKVTATGGVLSVAKDGKRPQFDNEEFESIVATAKDYDMHVAAHAHGAEGMKRAVVAGVTSIEHGTMIDDEVIDLMIEHGTYLVPTLTAAKEVEEKAKIPGYYPAIIVPKALEIGPKIQESCARAYKQGVKIAFGTDASVFPHGENAREFIYMVEAGIPMPECITMATVNAADLLGISELAGTLEKGKWADIIAVKKNPLENPDAFQQIDFIMKDGIIYKMNGQATPEK